MRFISMVGSAVLALATATHADVRINEVRIDETGTDVNEYVELIGTPGESLAGLTLLILGDGTSTSRSGVIEFKWTFAATDAIGTNGFFVLRKATMALPVDGGANSAAISPDNASGVFENGDNLTVMLVSGYSGSMSQGQTTSNGTDLDTNDDGILDLLPWTGIVDSMAILGTVQPPTAGSTTEEWIYSSSVCGPYLTRSLGTTVPSHLAYWAQNNNGITGQTGVFGFEVGDFPQAPTTGSQPTAGLSVGGGLLLESANNIYTWLESPTGTTVGALGTTTSGGSISVEAAPGNANNGSYLQLSLSMAGQSGLSLNFAARRSTTGFASVQPSVSTDGVTFTDVGSAVTPGSTAWATHQVNFGNSLDGASSVQIRLTLSGATGTDAAGTASTASFDNILLSNVPATTSFQVSRAFPVHAYRQPDGTWAMGSLTAALPTAGGDTPGSTNVVVPQYSCGAAGSGDCQVSHGNPFCADSCCCQYVCNLDPFCCQTRWDSYCAEAAVGCAANCGGSTCTGDFNDDGQVNGADLSALLGGWSGPDYDLTGDGVTNGADLSQLLGSWGQCP